MLKKLRLSIVVGLLVVVLCGCSAQISSPERHIEPAGTGVAISKATVVVTKDFGKEVLLKQTTGIEPGTTAMDALQMVASFVSTISGVSSEYWSANRSKKDWFFYINGISANTGALDYVLYPGDIEHWDFHNWGFHQFVPAIIGDFPEPFLHGYGGVAYPTIIAYQDGWGKDAEQIAYRLSQLGVASVSTASINELQADEKESSNLILLGTIDCQLIEELNQIWSKLGFYVHFQDNNLQVFTPKGDLAAEYRAGAGVIQATQSTWNPKGIGVCENVVWVVSGLDKAGVKNAVDALVTHHNNFKYACSVVIAGGEIIKVP